MGSVTGRSVEQSSTASILYIPPSCIRQESFASRKGDGKRLLFLWGHGVSPVSGSVGGLVSRARRSAMQASGVRMVMFS